MFQLLRWYLDEEYRAHEQKRLDSNVFCQHGKKYQLEAAALYSEISGNTLTPLGLVTGPVDNVPTFISATFDYICLEQPLVVEVKCPQKISPEWKTKYWVQCQHQLQLAQFKKLHLVMYIPATEHENGTMVIEEIERDDEWFKIAVPHYNRFWNMVNSYNPKESVQMYIKRVKKLCKK